MLHSVVNVVNDLTERVQVYEEQQWEQSISLVDPTFDGDLCCAVVCHIRTEFLIKESVVEP